MLRETTSLGVRRYAVSRVERPRRIVEVETPYGPIPVKIAEGPFGPPQVEARVRRLRRGRARARRPVREVMQAATAAAYARAR